MSAILPQAEDFWEGRGDDWSGFLGIASRDSDIRESSRLNAGKSVLITGAGGSIGSGLAKAILGAHPKNVVLFDYAEHGLYELRASLSESKTNCVEVIGDIRDSELVKEVFERYKPQIVYHAAALKQVPLSELNPLTVIHTNVFGTYVLVKAAVEHRAEQMILISTDKAVNPRSLMGASKRIAELVMLSVGRQWVRMKAVRFGNVLASRGSVVPLFRRQIARGGPITVTHPDARRFFLTLRQAVELILLAAVSSKDGIFIPKLDTQIKIVDLAHYLIREASTSSTTEIPIVFTGLRPGDKLSEEFVSTHESIELTLEKKLDIAKSPAPSAAEMETFMSKLEKQMLVRNVQGALDLMCQLVPDYRPSEALLAAAVQIRSRSSAR